MCGGGSSTQPAPRKVEIPTVDAGPNVITSEIIEGPDRVEPATPSTNNNDTSISTSSMTGLNIPMTGY